MKWPVIIVFALIFTSCSKDKYTTAPQIEFKEFDPNQGSNQGGIDNQPHMIIEVRDAEGDLGFIDGQDTSRIFIRNMLTNRIDSPILPNLGSAAGKNFKGDIVAGLFNVMGGRDLPSSQRPYVDTLQFEVYVKDFAGNQSNVIITDQPFYYFTLP